MADALPFAKEVVATIPSSDRWYRPEGREFRAFIKGPHRGVNKDTGLCLLLHGQGGRQNDISWKMLRRSLAEKHNLLVVGLNYFGTELSYRDHEFVTAQFEQAQYIVSKFPAAQALFAERKPLKLKPEDFFFFENPHTAQMASFPYPSEFWDWGVIQALDAVNALSFAIDQTKLQPTRISMVTRSAGAQVGMMLLKLLPHTFSSVLKLGGACYGGSKAGWLHHLLNDPFSRVSEVDSTGLLLEGENPYFGIQMRKKWPLANLGGNADLGPLLAAEVELRDVIAPVHLPAKSSLALIRAEHGAKDQHFSPAYIQEILNPYANLGVDVNLRTIQAEDCDGVLRDNDGHTFMKDYNKIVLDEHDQVFEATRAIDTPIDLNDGQSSTLACAGGVFTLTRSYPLEFTYQRKA